VMDKQLQLKVSGLHCAGCGQRATAAVRRLDGVREANPISRPARCGWSTTRPASR